MKDICLQAINKLKFQFPYTIDEWLNKDMVMENYHKHTTWSNLVQIDSATSIDEFIDRLESLGCKYYFSGEHGFQGEWLNCYDICKKRGIGFRYSVEAYWVKDINEIITEEYTDKKGEIKTREKKDNTNCHIVLVARNYQAMRKINYILSQAHGEGFYYKPRIDLNMLFTLSPEDVYVTSACVAGWKYDDACEIWYKIWKHFGDSFFLEYQTHNTDPQKEINKKILYLHQNYGIQTIIGLDTHYLDEKDCIKRDNVLKRKGTHYEDEEGWYMDFPNGRTVYDRMIEQGIVPAVDIVYSIMNTHVFVAGCEDLTDYDVQFKIPILKEYQSYSYDQRSDVLLNLLKEKYDNEDDEHKTQDRYDGMMYEYGEIIGSGCTDYFLSNHKLVHLAQDKYGGKLTTTSRGSASSYYSSKLLGFTTMDRFEAEVPIYPERFITKDRILGSKQMPDIDCNVKSQQPFVSAARELFGEHGCYPLLAVGKFGEKSGFKLYAGVNDIEPSVANDITSDIDRYNEALKNADDDMKDTIAIEDYITDRHHLDLFYSSKNYQNIIEQAKCHACGFALFNGNPRRPNDIGYGDLRYEIGLIRCYSEATGKSTIVCNIEGGLLDSYGYVKDDFLIVDVVGIIDELYTAIGMKVPPVSELRKMVDGDTATWNLYAKGITCCLNQCEKPGTTRRAQQYKPQNIKELAAFIAAIRPGFKSLLNGFLKRITYTNGEPAIDELLKDCFQYMIYQESVMKIFSYLGIPMKDSYDTIKKISKKKLKGEALKHVESTLRQHWLENIGNLDNFDPVYKVIKDSARYSFNAPHALAMANDSLYEAWMKAHHTSVFYEVTLNHYQAKGDKNKVAELLKEAMECFGYEMASFEYGQDNSQFRVDDSTKQISSNLASIKGIGVKAAEDIYKISQQELEHKGIYGIYKAIKGTSVNTSVFRNLIKIGYFKKFGSVKKLLKIVDLIDLYDGKKSISKSKMPEFGFDISEFATDILKSGKRSEKQYTIFNPTGFMLALIDTVPDDEYGLPELLKMSYEVLGYIDFVNENISNRYVFVTDLNTTYSPKFKGYCLKNGMVVELKVSAKKNPRNKTIKTTFKDVPFEDGDVLYMKSCDKKPRQRKTDTGWEVVPGEFNWWITDYYLVKNI